MAWANQEVIGEISKLPQEALDAYIVNPEWTVGKIIRHIASGSNWYVWRLLNHENFNEEEKEFWNTRLQDAEEDAQLMQDPANVLTILKDSDTWLLEQSKLPDGDVLREFRRERYIFKRSTILAQAVHHATEHRAQAVAALDLRGFGPINLDRYDLWNYQIRVGE